MLKLPYVLQELSLWTQQQWITFSFWTYNYHLKWDTHLLQGLLTAGVLSMRPCGETFWVHCTAPVHSCCLSVSDTESDEGPSASPSLAQNMTTCFMNWISDFFPNTVNKVYKILHCAKEFITIINNAQIVFQHRIRKFPFTTVTGHSAVMGAVW